MKYLLLSFLLLFSTVAFSQTPTESTVIDTAEVSEHYYDVVNEDPPETHGADDSLGITHRAFADSVVKELKSDPDLQYEEIPTIAESLWSRIWSFIKGLFKTIFNVATDTSWPTILLYVGGTAAVVLVIFMLLKVNAFDLFYGKQKAGATGATMFDENIHEMDFEALIQEATRSNDYRKGVRLVFLYALKILSDKQLIVFDQGKTNHDYVAELEKPELKEGLHELSYYFDYAWYGNFKVSAEVFGKVQNAFKVWRSNIR